MFFRKGRRVYNSHSYVYAFKYERKTDSSQVFRCRSVDGTGKECLSRVILAGNSYTPSNDHTCIVKPAPNIYERDVIVRKAKAVGLKFKAVSASNVLRSLLENYAHDNVILPDPTNLQRIVNRTRASNLLN